VFTGAWVADCALDRPTMIERRSHAGGAVPSCAAAPDVDVLLDGELFDVDALAEQWDLPFSGAANPAAVALEAYQRHADGCGNVLNGRFVMIVADRRKRQIIAVRDRIGMHPLYYARGTGGRLVLSSSIPAILADRDVSAAIDPVVIAEHLLHRFIDASETHYAAVRRVPPGHVLTADHDGCTTRRYWDPGASMAWLKADELDEFDQTFERAVARCTAGRPAIFLSGGFDSVSVAAVATDLGQRHSGRKPHALSLGFPDAEGGESFVQRSVAHGLGLSQDLVEFEDAVAPRGLIPAALDLGATFPLPMLNTWAPAYQHLGRLGAARGCTAILTGTGGDEWLNVSPLLAADLIRRGRIRDVARLIGIFRRSFRHSPAAIARMVIWRCGLRPLLAAAVDAAAPRLNASRRLQLLVRSTPNWIAPDPSIRRALDERAKGALLAARPARGFYEQQMQLALDHPLVAIELEEHFELGRRLGLRMLHPYLDADLVALLYRTPPALLTQGGRTKAVVRSAVARRFPNLGFDVQRKTNATAFFRRSVCAGAGAVWNASSGLPALSELGVVDSQEISADLGAIIAGHRPHETHQIWNVLNLEGWARARM